jgi:hypothetical protein
MTHASKGYARLAESERERERERERGREGGHEEKGA